jgi:hypothetical protein
VQAIGRQPQRAPDGAPVHYERHRPEQTTLYRLVQQHAATFIAETEAATGADLPQFVKDEFDSFLECGILAHGFLRLRCGDCGHDDGDSDEARVLRPLQAAACTYRIAFGPRAGQKVLTLQGAMPRDGDFKQTLCADNNGFSLHAAVRCAAEDRQALEQLCRYITRPALANERVQTNAAGQVVLKLKTPWRDGTTHLVMSPLEFMQRLAALVPRPRLHLIRLVSA